MRGCHTKRKSVSLEVGCVLELACGHSEVKVWHEIGFLACKMVKSWLALGRNVECMARADFMEKWRQ